METDKNPLQNQPQPVPAPPQPAQPWQPQIISPTNSTAPPTPSPQPLSPPVAPSFGPTAPPAGPMPPSASPAPVAPASFAPATPAQGGMTPPASGGVVTGGIEPPQGGMPTFQAPSTGDPSKTSKKKLFIPASIILLALVVGLGFYFLYWNNPSVILSQSMKRSGKGVDKLITYLDQQSKIDHKGYEGSGSYKIAYGGTTTDGSLKLKSYGGNSQTTFDMGLGVTRIKFEARSIKVASSDTPDIYIQGTGIKGLGSLTGSAEIDQKVNALDGKWIVIDHTLFDNLTSMASASAGASAKQATPTQADIVDGLHAFNKVNQEYVFTTNKDKAVAVVTEKKGKETVDGHKLYRYAMAPNKQNIKSYISAQQQALNSSKLGQWAKKSGFQSDLDQSFAELKKSADSIKSSETFDLWVDTKTRLIYKVRFSESKNPATNYSEIGLDYKGGSSYPFFITGKSNTEGVSDTATLMLTINSKDNSVGVKFGLKQSGVSGFNATGQFTFKPSDKKVEITAPTGAESLSQVMSELGLGDLLSGLQSYSGSQSDGGVNAGIQSRAKDSKRQSDILSLQTQIEAYFAMNGFYPSRSNMNSASWLKTNMKSLDTAALQDPDSSSSTLAATPTANKYAYAVTDASGKSCEADSTRCAKYTLTAMLSTGAAYAKQNLD